MANLSDYLEEALIEHVLVNSSYTSPTDVYLGIMSDSAGTAELEAGTLTNEIDGYTGNRKTLSFGTATQVEGKATCLTNETYDFEDMPAVTVSYAIITDSATKGAGNILVWMPLSTPRTVGAGDTLRFPSGDISVSLA
jgi:hypothetical protein